MPGEVLIIISCFRQSKKKPRKGQPEEKGDKKGGQKGKADTATSKDRMSAMKNAGKGHESDHGSKMATERPDSRHTERSDGEEGK